MSRCNKLRVEPDLLDQLVGAREHWQVEGARAVVSIVQPLVPVEALYLGSRSVMFQQDTENQSVRYQ
jgi:hypothetical protein